MEGKMQSSAYLHNENRRQYQRKPYVRTVSYRLSGNEFPERKTFDRNGSVIDISKAGLCIQTVNPLSEGNVVYFDDAIKYAAGIVRWCEELDALYRAGIEIRTDVADTEHAYEEVAEKSLLVREGTEEYTGILDAATEKFNREMADIEDKCIVHHENPEAIPMLIREAIDEMIQACEDFENKVIDREVIRKARIRFRQKTDAVFSKSYCTNRARIWPQGSQGDYKTLEILYKNTTLSEGIGYYLDRIMLDMPLGHAVRDRIKKLELMLKDELLKRHEPAILNIACGACRELVGIVPEIIDSAAKVVCIDSDNNALDYAQGRLSDAGLRENIEFYKYNALRLFDYETSMEEFGKQDIIYSVGLFDYLPSDFLVKMFSTLYKMLNPGGRFIPAFKDAQRYRSQYYHWFVDWDGFLQRKEGDFKKILSDAGIPSSSITEVRDKTGIIVFYLITK
jgi:SAM-dependent methyltransferase